MRLAKVVTVGAAMLVAVAVIVAVTRHYKSVAISPAPAIVLPTTPDSYLGVYRKGVPDHYAGVTAMTDFTGVRPNVVMYYSIWKEPFRTTFAQQAARHGAVPMVQIETNKISLAAIASGHYDNYLRTYASAVRSYGHAVILGFGHEMNGYWYTWGTRHHTTPAQFVAAWRHIVRVFRSVGANNVTWLWTVNIIDAKSGIRTPGPWWPGSSYVNWVGIDGYYYKPSWAFAPLFGPTIKAVRAFTRDPILISETGASDAAGKAAKITNVFAGIRAYGLLGFVWFDAVGLRDWRIDTGPAAAAQHPGAAAYKRTAS